MVKDSRDPGVHETGIDCDSQSVESNGSGSENTRDEVYEDSSLSHISNRTVPRSTIYPDIDGASVKLRVSDAEGTVETNTANIEALSLAKDAGKHDESSIYLHNQSSVSQDSKTSDGDSLKRASDQRFVQLNASLRTDDEQSSVSHEKISSNFSNDDNASTKSRDLSFDALFDQEFDGEDDYCSNHPSSAEPVTKEQVTPSDECISVADYGNASVSSNVSTNASVFAGSFRSHFFSEDSSESDDTNSDDGGLMSVQELVAETDSLQVPSGSPVEDESNDDVKENDSGFNLRILWDMLSISDHSTSTSSSDSRLGVLRLRTRHSSSKEEHSENSSVNGDESGLNDQVSRRRQTIYEDEEVQRQHHQRLVNNLSGYSTPSETDEDEISDSWSVGSAVEFEQCEGGMVVDNHIHGQQSGTSLSSNGTETGFHKRQAEKQQKKPRKSTQKRRQDTRDEVNSVEDSVGTSFQKLQGRCLLRRKKGTARRDRSHKDSSGGVLSDTTLAMFAWSLLFCGLVMLGICAIIFVSLEFSNDGDSNGIDSSSLSDDFWPGTDNSTNGTQGDIFVSSGVSP
jgi:hypothetical protein